MQRTVKRILLIAAAFALFVVPAAAIAAAGFNDVADSSIFVADIQWMKDNDITRGCNPPTNDRFCPSSNVTREQMSAFMHRLATNQVVDAATALEADHATAADNAANADTLDGKNSTDFVEHGVIVQPVGAVGWLEHATPPSAVNRYVSYMQVNADGAMVLSANAPTSYDGTEYGLSSIKVCLDFSGSSYLTTISAWRGDSASGFTNILANTTNRSLDGCYTYAIGKSVGVGAGFYMLFAGGGTVNIEGTVLTWSQDAAVLGESGGATGSENGG